MTLDKYEQQYQGNEIALDLSTGPNPPIGDLKTFWAAYEKPENGQKELNLFENVKYTKYNEAAYTPVYVQMFAWDNQTSTTIF